MATIDNITSLAQDVYFTINGSDNEVTGAELTTFQNQFIRSFNLWLDEYENEAYWNEVRTNNYELATISNTTTYQFPLPDDYRTPVFDQDKELKFVSDGAVIARFDLVSPNQINGAMDPYTEDKATFVGRNVVLSRAPHDTEVGAKIVLDVVSFFPKLSENDDDAISLVASRQLAVLGVAKNNTLSNIVKDTLTPSITQKYSNELAKAIAINDATNEANIMRRDSYGYIGGIW